MNPIGGLVLSDPARSVSRAVADAFDRRFKLPPEQALVICDKAPVHLLSGRAKGQSAPEVSDTLPVKVVADARLDERLTLAGKLGANERLSDAELIALAYVRWGAECVERLEGEFAFAIWDGGKGQLFCARDRMGVMPFHYRCDGDGIAFATRANALSRADDTLDKGRIATYLGGFDDSDEETAFTAVRRLPPGHWLRWTAGDLRIERYWRLDADSPPPGEDFAAGFRQRFMRSVEERLAGGGEIGALLSGGLDSSSIVSAAAKSRLGDGSFRLRTFSFSYPNSPAFDEREYVDAVLADYPLAPTFVDMDSVSPVEGLAGLIDGRDDIFFSPGIPKIARVLAVARAGGVTTMLDGHGGDEVASHGFGRLRELAQEGRWVSLYRELRGVSSIFGDSPLALLSNYYFSYGIGARIRRRLRRLKASRSGGPQPDRPAALALVSRDLEARTDVAARYAQWRDAYRRAAAHERDFHAWNVSSPAVARSFETLRRAGDGAGIDLRFPFYDHRLVSYALATPDSEKLRDGWSRSLLRRAMKDILPEKVRWRRTKINFGPELATGLLRRKQWFLGEALREGSPVGEYVDLDAARSLVSRLAAAPAADGTVLFGLWRVAFLALWLEQRAAAAVDDRAVAAKGVRA